MTTQRIKTSDAISGNASPELTGNKTTMAASEKSRKILDALGEFGPGGINRRKILEVADAIEHSLLVKEKVCGHSVGFNMATYGNTSNEFGDHTGHKCGTVACIAGWTTIMDAAANGTNLNAPSELHKGTLRYPSTQTLWDDLNQTAHSTAQEILGLSSMQAAELFMPEFEVADEKYEGGTDYEDLSDKQAVSVLRHLAETGDVRWDLFDNKGNPV